MAEYLRINADNPDSKAIQKSGGMLENGGVIIYPTDTVYGLGVMLANQEPLKGCSIEGNEA